MRKTLFLSGLLLSALLAGCTDDARTDDATVPPPETPLALGLNDCIEQFAVLPIPWDAAAAMLPEGFTPVAFDANAEGVLATEFVIAYGCANATGAVEDANATLELTGGLFVVPPEQYLAEGVEYYAWTYGFFTTNEKNAELYNSWHLSHSLVGEVMVGSLADNAALGVGHALGSAEGFTVHLYTTVQGDAVAGEAGSVRMFGFDPETMNVTNAVDFAWSEATSVRSGQGVVRVEPETDYVPPVGAGFGFQYAGGYSYTLTYVELEPTPEPHAAHMDLVGSQIRAL